MCARAGAEAEGGGGALKAEARGVAVERRPARLLYFLDSIHFLNVTSLQWRAGHTGRAAGGSAGVPHCQWHCRNSVIKQFCFFFIRRVAVLPLFCRLTRSLRR